MVHRFRLVCIFVGLCCFQVACFDEVSDTNDASTEPAVNPEPSVTEEPSATEEPSPEEPSPGEPDPGEEPEPGEPDPGEPDPGEEPDPVEPDPAPTGEPCLGDVFLEVAPLEGAGEEYPTPSLSVTCTDDTVLVESNGIPHYAFQPVTPNPLRAQEHRWEIPRSPVLAQEKVEIPLLGVVGFAINGLPLYGPNEGERPDPFGDPVFNDILDWCQGHTAQRGDYHYHALLVECFFLEFEEQDASPILGFALDGFPIYGPRGCLDEACTEVVTFQSSWELIGDPSTYVWDANTCTRESCREAQGEFLDQCNGRIGPDGTYRYHVTSTFPYILGCYHGEQARDNTPSPEMEPPEMDPPEMEPPEMEPPEMEPSNGPASCETEADCVGQCPGDRMCACARGPMNGMICVPTCETDDDCPTDGNRVLRCDTNRGLCVPERP